MKNKILVVDDNENTRMLVQAILDSHGYDVVLAEDGKQALDILRSSESDHFLAIFLDILMPGLSGLEVLKVIKETINISSPVIMLTTKDLAADFIVGYNLGADYYVSKPFTGEQLIYGLDLVLNQQPQGELESGAEDQGSLKEAKVWEIEG